MLQRGLASDEKQLVADKTQNVIFNNGHTHMQNLLKMVIKFGKCWHSSTLFDFGLHGDGVTASSSIIHQLFPDRQIHSDFK